MVINVKYDINTTCRAVLQEQLDKLGIPYVINGVGEVKIKGALPTQVLSELTDNLGKYGIHILSDKKVTLVHLIKVAIDEMLQDDMVRLHNVSSYLANQLNYSYSYLSNLFSEVTFTSIENFVILRKVDHAKELMANDQLTLTEIAYRLNYSSVAHLSTQFKKTTGLTPTRFQKILEKRKAHRMRNAT